MSALTNFAEQVRGYVGQGMDLAKKRLLGANNERLDLLIDTFYKLTPNQRNLVLGGTGAAIALFVILGVGLYFGQLRSLSIELNRRFDALHELRNIKIDYQQEQRRFDKLSEIVERKTAQLRIKPFFEKIANAQGVVVEGLTESRVPMPAENPLSQKFQEVKIDLRVNNISIPRLMNFLIEIEKSGNYIRVNDLQIRGRYGTKLYFDAQIKARGYVIAN